MAKSTMSGEVKKKEEDKTLELKSRCMQREPTLCIANEDVEVGGAFCLIHHIDYVINI